MSKPPDQSALISRYLDNELGPDEVEALEAWIGESRDNALTFLRLSYNDSRIRQRLLSENLPAVSSLREGGHDMSETDRFMLELMQIETRLQAEVVDATDILEERDLANQPQVKRLRRSRDDEDRGPRTIVIPLWLVYGSAAVLALAVVGLFYSLHEPAPQVAEEPPVQEAAPVRSAVYFAIDPQTGHTETTGTDVFPGDQLSAGATGGVLKLGSGAVVRLSPDTKLAVRNDNRCGLTHGQLTATVPPNAIGFEVEVPDGLVRDLGTEFTIDLDGTRVSQVRVLKGEISLHKRTGSGQVLRGHVLVEGEAGVIDPDKPEPAIVRTALLDLKSTGTGAAPGLTDLNWDVAKLSNDADYHAKPAMVFVGDHGKRNVDWYDNNASSAWIGQPEYGDPYVPEDQITTYRHRFTVPEGADPESIVVEMDIWADDYLHLITINGVELLEPENALAAGSHYQDPVRFAIDRGILVGDNTLLIAVQNDHDQDLARSPSGLRVQFVPTRVRVLVPASEDRGR